MDNIVRIEDIEPTVTATPVDEEPWPVMGEDAYYGLAGEIVRTIEPHSEADPVALLIQTLVCFGNVIGRTRYYRHERTRHHTNLYCILVGATSEGRKGTSFDWVRDIFKVAEEQWAKQNIKSGLSSAEGLMDVVHDGIPARGKHAAIPAVADKRVLILQTEFASVLHVMERGGSTLSPLLREAWDGNRLQKMTINNPITATDHHISVIGHITPDEYRANLTRTDTANGFANRYLNVLVKRSKLLPFGGDPGDSEILRLGEELRDAIRAARYGVDLHGNLQGSGDPLPPPQLTMTDDARTEWARVYPVLMTPRRGMFGEVTARAAPLTIRLALVYALMDRNSRIELPHLKAALAVWMYCEASAKFIFGSTLGNPVADEILRALKRAGAAGMSRNDIYNLFNRHQDRSSLGSALAMLARAGLARSEKRSSGGIRPIEVWLAV